MEIIFKSVLLSLLCLQLDQVFGLPTGGGETDTGCGGKPADVIFVLDASFSIHPNDFQHQTDFVTSVVSEFDIGEKKTRIGLIAFSSYVQDVFGLGQYTDKMNVLAAIRYARQLTGSTYTDRALLHAREMMRKEGRKNVPKIVIILTDGKSDFPELTKDEARETKKKDITIISIGIGQNVDEEELKAISSAKEDSFKVDTFAALEKIRSTLAIRACEIQADSPWYENEIIKMAKPAKPEKFCEGRPADIVFCLDASGSIWGPDFYRQLQFVKDLASVFQISPDITRIGVLTFGDRPVEAFKLDRYKYEEDVVRAIGAIHQSRGGTNTGGALSTMTKEFFSESQKRADVVQLAIVITDGKSGNRADTRVQAQRLRDSGIKVFAVGVGTRVDEHELHIIASQPSRDYVFRVENYGALDKIKELLAAKTCQVTLPPTTMPPIYGCGLRRPADVVFAMPPDADAAQAGDILSMMANLADKLDMGDDAVKIGMVPKECISLPGIELTDKLDTKSMIEEFGKGYAQAATSKIIKYMRRKSFGEINGGRDHAQKMAIIILDSNSPNYKETAIEAAKARKNGVEMFVIAIGDKISMDELKQIASYPIERHLIKVASYDELDDVIPNLVDNINQSCIEYVPDEKDEVKKKIIKANKEPFNKMDLFNGLERYS